MQFLVLSLLLFKELISFNTNNNFPLKDIFLYKNIESNLQNNNGIKEALRQFLKKFPQYDEDLFNICTENLFNKTGEIENFLYLLSFSGKALSDLGQESSCLNYDFSYYLLSYDYDSSLEPKDKKNKIFNFLGNNKFYTGICLLPECDGFINKIFINYSNGPIQKISVNQINDNNEVFTGEDKSKYNTFKVFYIITLIILFLEIFISLFIYCGYNFCNNSKDLISEIYEESDLDDDEENSDEEPNEKVLYSNSSSSKEKKNETCFQIFIKTLYKYFSFFTNTIILTMKKSKFFNNKNIETIIKLRIFAILLIAFSTNFDVYIKFPSKGYYNDFLYKKIYFMFLKFASFGLDMYICLDGFEVMFKLMNYYKRNFYEKGNKTISFLGILKFYLFAVYKIVAYIIFFFLVNYFNKYYIYIHNDGTFYTYYTNNIMNDNSAFEIVNPKYSILSYFPLDKKYDEEFLFSSKMSLLFLNEFYAFTLFLIIFYIGNILKSKIYDYAILAYVFISYSLSYLLNNLKDNASETQYTYNKIIRNISLIKFPHVLFNHYLLGAFTGLICFYLKDSILNNSMMTEPEKCPFRFCLNAIELFDYLIQKGRRIWMSLSFIIQILLSSTFTIIININDQDIPLNFNSSLRTIYYYESGLFIFTFCFNTILFFANDADNKNFENYSLLNLIYQISFSFVNTIYLLMYSYYCYFRFQLKLTYQNLWLITLGLFIFFCLENLILTIIFVMPFKIIFKTLLDKYIVLNPRSLSIEEIKCKGLDKRINNSGLSNQFMNSYEDDELDGDKNDS